MQTVDLIDFLAQFGKDDIKTLAMVRELLIKLNVNMTGTTSEVVEWMDEEKVIQFPVKQQLEVV